MQFGAGNHSGLYFHRDRNCCAARSYSSYQTNDNYSLAMATCLLFFFLFCFDYFAFYKKTYRKYVSSFKPEQDAKYADGSNPLWPILHPVLEGCRTPVELAYLVNRYQPDLVYLYYPGKLMASTLVDLGHPRQTVSEIVCANVSFPPSSI